MSDSLFESTSEPLSEQPCAWCGKTPAVPFEVEPPIYATRKVPGAKPARVLRKRAIVSYACHDHASRFFTELAEREETKRRERGK